MGPELTYKWGRNSPAKPVEQFLPAGPLDLQARAELAWVAAVMAVDTGDDTAALAAGQRLAPLLAGIQDPFLRAVCQLAMAWSLPIAGDLDGALREAAVSLEQLRGQDEPVFTAIAAFTVGSLEMALGRYDDALRYLREARDLAEVCGGDWFAAGSRVQLGILAVLRGRLDEARALLDEALDLSLAARSTRFVTLCLAGYARLALAEGDPERAARLKGAAEGLRRRVGLPGLASSAAGGGRSGGPDPPEAGSGPVRSGVHRCFGAHPAGGGSDDRPGPARRQDPDVLSRYAHSPEAPAWTPGAGGGPGPASAPLPGATGQPGVGVRWPNPAIRPR